MDMNDGNGREALEHMFIKPELEKNQDSKKKSGKHLKSQRLQELVRRSEEVLLDNNGQVEIGYIVTGRLYGKKEIEGKLKALVEQVPSGTLNKGYFFVNKNYKDLPLIPAEQVILGMVDVDLQNPRVSINPNSRAYRNKNGFQPDRYYIGQ